MTNRNDEREFASAFPLEAIAPSGRPAQMPQGQQRRSAPYGRWLEPGDSCVFVSLISLTPEIGKGHVLASVTIRLQLRPQTAEKPDQNGKPAGRQSFASLVECVVVLLDVNEMFANLRWLALLMVSRHVAMIG